MSSFVPTKEHLREALLFCFRLKKSAGESHRLLVQAYGKHALSETTCREWFRRFKPDIHGRKVMLCIWWDQVGVVYSELLQPGEKPSVLNGTDVNYSMRNMHSRRNGRNTPKDMTRLFFSTTTLDLMSPNPSGNFGGTWLGCLIPPALFPEQCSADFHLFRLLQHGLSE
ncbi:hypothetical protein JGG62_24225 [Salmonella enterica subsp. enterica serovar Typhimurium]|nr:hypothetical protein [Salmonella enterica subsp. enterica serovar Typhimurium]